MRFRRFVIDNTLHLLGQLKDEDVTLITFGAQSGHLSPQAARLARLPGSSSSLRGNYQTPTPPAPVLLAGTHLSTALRVCVFALLLHSLSLNRLVAGLVLPG